jgi:peptidoglycan-associated lipoprotein
MKNMKVSLVSVALSALLVLVAGCSSDEDPNANLVPAAELGPGGTLDGTLDPLGGAGGTAGPWGEPGGGVPGSAGEWQEVQVEGFPVVVYFAYDQDNIGTSERSKIDEVGRYMQENQAMGLIIEGHCDERGSVEYNRALGERRAISVRNYLVNLGVPDSRFKTISYGEERPAVEGNTQEAWAKNRRAELKPAKMQ